MSLDSFRQKYGSTSGVTKSGGSSLDSFRLKYGGQSYMASVEEQKKKKKQWETDQINTSQMQAQEPPVAKPVDQIEHEEKEYRWTAFNKKEEVTKISQAPKDERPLDRDQIVALDYTKANFKEKVADVSARTTQVLYGGLKGAGEAVAGLGRSMQRPAAGEGSEYDLFRNDTLGGNAVNKGKSWVGKGMEDFGKEVARLMGAQGELYTDKKAIIQEYDKPLIDPETNKWRKDLLTSPSYIIAKTSEGLYSTIPVIAANVYSGGAPGASVLAGFLLEKGNSYEDYSNAIAKMRGVEVKDLSKEDVKLADDSSSLYGAISAPLEALPIEGLLSKIGGTRVAKSWIMAAITELPKDVITQMLQEGTTEGLQQFAQNVIAKKSGVDPNRDLMEGVPESAFSGATSGGFMGMAPALVANRGGDNINVQPPIPGETPPPDDGTPPPPPPGSPVAIQEGSITESQKNSRNVSDIIDALSDDNRDRVNQIAPNLTIEDLNSAKDVLDKAYQRASEEMKPAIADDISYLTNLSRDRLDKIQEVAGEVVSKKTTENLDNDIEGLNASEVDEINAMLDQAKEITQEEYPAITNKTYESAQKAKSEIEELQTQKKELLAKKSEVKEESPEAAKEIQATIDGVDKKINELKDFVRLPVRGEQQKAETEKFSPEVQVARDGNPILKQAHDEALARIEKGDVEGAKRVMQRMSDLQSADENQFPLIRDIQSKLSQPQGMQFSGDTLRELWGNGKPIEIGGKKYSVHKMSYGDYFIEPYGKELGETEGFAEGTHFLEKTDPQKNIYSITEDSQQFLPKEKGITPKVEEKKKSSPLVEAARERNKIKAEKTRISDREKAIKQTADRKASAESAQTKEMMDDYEKKLKEVTTQKKKGKGVSITKAIKTIVTKSSLPIIELVKVKDGKLYATDLSVGLVSNTNLENGMYKLVGEDFVPDKKYNDDEFPVVPDIAEKGAIGKLITENVVGALKPLLLAVDKNATREELTGVYFKIEKGMIEMAATDSFRLTMQKIGAKLSKETAEFILGEPKKISQILETVGETVEIREDEDFVGFYGENGYVIVKKIVGKYPEYHQIYPNFKTQYVFDKAQLKDALKQLKPYTEKYSGQVSLSLSADKKSIVLSAETAETGKKEMSINFEKNEVSSEASKALKGTILMPIRDGQVSGSTKPDVGVFNIKYFEDVLKALEGDTVFMSLVSDERPFHFSDTNVMNKKKTEEKSAALSTDNAEKLLSKQWVDKVIKESYGKLNPNIRAVTSYTVFEKIIDKQRNILSGQAGKSGIDMSQSISDKEFLDTLPHEEGHFVTLFLDDAGKKDLVDYYRGLNRRELISIFGSKSRLEDYEEKYKGYENPELTMADETLQHDMDRDRFYEKHPIRETIKKLVEIIKQIIQAIKSLLTEEGKIIRNFNDTRTFYTRKQKRRVMRLYKEAFNPNIGLGEGYFGNIVSSGRIAEIKENGFSANIKYAEGPRVFASKSASIDESTIQILRGTNGLTADQIMKQHPDIVLKRDVPAKDIYGNKVEIPAGEALTPYELKGNKILLQDGETYIVSKNQFQNIKGNAVSGEAKEFAPELRGTEESVRGGKPSLSESDVNWKKTSKEGEPKVINGTLGDRKFVIQQEGEHYYVAEVGGILGKTTRNYTSAVNEINSYLASESPSTKYSSYQLPDGKNYKEVLIKAPVGKVERGVKNSYNNDTTFLADAPTFKSSHWDEPNVISHLRMNERTYQGKKVTFVEEMQSDWAREARKGEKQIVNPLDNPDFHKPVLGELPTHPLLKNWQELSIKRALKEAVDNGSDYLAWISGEQTSARYNLATHIDNIEWKNATKQGEKIVNITPKEGSGLITAKIDSTGKVMESAGATGGQHWTGKNIDEVLGKGLADKIMAEETGQLSGEGLTFGGEWAKNLYDKQIKNIVEDLTGGKVEVLDMGIMGEKVVDWYSKEQASRANAIPLKPSELKVGNEVFKNSLNGGTDGRYIITDILGDGKFEAVKKEDYTKDYWEAETFDISAKKSTGQQAIKITPEIRALVKGESIPLKKASGNMFESLEEEQMGNIIPEKPQTKAELYAQSFADNYGYKPAATNHLQGFIDYKEEIADNMGGMEHVYPLELPEMVGLAKALTGKYPTIHRGLRNALGYAYSGSLDVKLVASLFADGRIKEAKAVLAHELGHIADYLPERFSGGGNLLSRVANLTRNLKNRLEGDPRFSNKEMRAELLALAKYWRPSEVRTKKQDSSSELYAEAFSVLYNSPALLQEKAPMFTQALFEFLDRKPEVKSEFFAVQELLGGSREDIVKQRQADLRKGFAKAEKILEKKMQDKKGADKRLWERLRQQLDDSNYPIIKKQNEKEAAGQFFQDEKNPRFLLENLPFMDNENYLLLDDINRDIVQPLETSGITMDDIGEYMVLKRIINGRKDIANPYGFTPASSVEQMDYLKNSLGVDKFNLMEEKLKSFHDFVYKSVEEAVKVGSYNEEIFKEVIEPNKESYAAFRVVDYIDENMPAGIKKQVGTFKEIANPFTATILKTVALNRLNAYQKAKRATIEMLGNEAEKSRTITSDGKLKLFRVAKGKGGLEVLEDGKLVSYDVDPYIAESFEKSNISELNAIVKAIDIFNNRFFKPVVTTYNMGFALAFNPIRDFKRNYKNIKKATLYGLLKAYFQSVPSAYKYAKGNLDEFTRMLVENKAINAPIYDYNFDPREDEFGKIMEKYGLFKSADKVDKLPPIIRKTVVKGAIKILEIMRLAANTFEVVSKVAGTKVRMKQGESGESLYYNVRNFTGTPNWTRKGKHTQTTNALFVFSNIMKEGLKGDYIIATSPNTRKGYWWKTVKVDLLPKLLMFGAQAGLLGFLVGGDDDDWLKRFYEGVSEYDKTNYIIIPLGINDDGKSVYMRIPHDETGRLISAVTWKMLNFIKDKEPKELSQIFALGAGQLPNLSPAVSIPISWVEYLSGKNPYDWFRGRNIIDDTTFNAGGMRSLTKMLKWTANSSGAAQFATYDTSTQSGVETFFQLAPFFNRLFKISDYGNTELEYKEMDKTTKENAKKLLLRREIIAEELKKETPAEDIISRLEVELELDQEADDYNTKINAFEKEIEQQKEKLKGNSTTNLLLRTQRNADKVRILKKHKDQVSEDAFYDYLNELYDSHIISDDVYEEL